jgi:hypothetical protein
MDSKQDLFHVENLIKAIKKGTFSLDGLEVLAFAESFKWLGKLGLELQERVKQGELQQKMMAQAKVAQSTPAPVEPTPPLETKPAKKVKKSEAK